MSAFTISTELPVFTVVRLDEEGMLDALVKEFQRGQKSLVHIFPMQNSFNAYRHAQPKIEVDKLAIADGNLVFTIVDPDFPQKPLNKLVAKSSDFAIWNHVGRTHFVPAEPDTVWSNELIPASLLTLIPLEPAL